MSEIVGACLSQFHDDANTFEILLAFSDGREFGYTVSRQVARRIASEFANEFELANARNKALEEAAALIDQYMLCGVGADVLLPRGNSGNKVGFGYAAAIRALKAEGESRE